MVPNMVGYLPEYDLAADSALSAWVSRLYLSPWVDLDFLRVIIS